MDKIFALAFIAGLFAGCSSRATTPSNNSAARQSSNSSAGPNPEPSANSDTAPLNSNHTPTIAELREKHRLKSLINAPSSGPLPAPQFRPAPENSTVATSMNQEGAVIETRVFKNNPQLIKVEMKWIGPKDSTLKIFLKDGRIVEAKGGKIENLGSTPVSVLLEMAGIKASK